MPWESGPQRGCCRQLSDLLQDIRRDAIPRHRLADLPALRAVSEIHQFMIRGEMLPGQHRHKLISESEMLVKIDCMFSQR